ncbi:MULTISPECIES: hypothetical protein [unclassified Mesorhizobium]|uniref:hypothetical protein n=1 Tax=unclassified Mesorhizobium TaxID=325217 RepID=UPI000FDA6FE8|nr:MULTISPECIES: hypothetical protein [unclassified Mesorhizobium]TGQ08995.1 hypothetical protein EN862_022450 [Mesorhizobium sp. M2E.F.Ca.ET.219.01.1.1]TGT69530.1 hypothetical protein EN809_024730 [Mesorhizobium sp. M2E.F.Ca.ET.166.01.1.1]TGW01862.1 hypothetical protein EN797_016225 [Mesorhizobium sp. M2E.F.Ca.ET.154.01.1.1]
MPDLLLDGSLSTPTCLQLAFIAYLKVFGFIAVFVAIWIAIVCINGLMAPDGFRWDLKAIRADPTVKPILIVCGIAALATIATISLTGPLSRLRIKMIATDSAFVETGCYIGAQYVESLDRKQTTISYVLHGGKMLRFEQQGQRPLYVPIESNPNFGNLVRIAPTAMSEYMQLLR